MPKNDLWPLEMQMVQEALVWLVPDEATARTLVSEAGIPETFIDFGEPVWNRIKRIMVEADKRGMMPDLLRVITYWYKSSPELIEAKAAWEAGEERKEASRLLLRAARSITEPVAVAKITRKEDEVRRVEVDVKIPAEEKTGKKPPTEVSVSEVELDTEPIHTDHMEAGDWFSVQKTLIDQERRIAEIEEWRRQLSIMPTKRS